MKNLIKITAPAIFARLYRESLRACGASRQSGDTDARMTFLRRVSVDYYKRLEANGIYVEHAGLPECQTKEWRARDRADGFREISWMVAVKKSA